MDTNDAIKIPRKSKLSVFLEVECLLEIALINVPVTEFITDTENDWAGYHQGNRL